MNLDTCLKTMIKALSQYTLYIWYPQLMHIKYYITIYLLNTCQIMAPCKKKPLSYYWIASDLVPTMHVCINSKNNSDVCYIYKSNYEILNWKSYPDIIMKRYSNNGRIVDADDEYLGTSEWRKLNRLFRIDKIH